MSALPDVLVVDASVVAKLYMTEEGTDRARHLLIARHSLLAPDLLPTEVGNVFWQRVRRSELTLECARKALGALRALPLRLYSARDLLDSALEIAASLDRTVYDSLYVALAVSLDTVLVTSDQRLHHAIAASPLAGHTALLTDVPPALSTTTSDSPTI